MSAFSVTIYGMDLEPPIRLSVEAPSFLATAVALVPILRNELGPDVSRIPGETYFVRAQGNDADRLEVEYQVCETRVLSALIQRA